MRFPHVAAERPSLLAPYALVFPKRVARAALFVVGLLSGMASAADVAVEVVTPGRGTDELTEGDFAEVRTRVTLAGGEALPGYPEGTRTWSFVAGAESVIPGWQAAISGMREGEVRRALIPAELAYGSSGSYLVPPDTALRFDIELIALRRPDAADGRLTPRGALVIVLVPGTEGGAVIARGARVTVHYTGWIAGGARIDSSRDRQRPFTFTIGRGQVIDGWEEGMLGARQGSRLRLEVPPALGYGARGTMDGSIPPDSRLIYDLEILAVEAPGADDPTILDETRMRTTASGLQYVDLAAGTGRVPQVGQRVLVEYVGRLENGKVFSSSEEDGHPLSVKLGGGQLIRGWEETLLSMPVGCQRRVRIPPALGFGERGAPPKIPPNATLYFDIELLDVMDE